MLKYSENVRYFRTTCISPPPPPLLFFYLATKTVWVFVFKLTSSVERKVLTLQTNQRSAIAECYKQLVIAEKTSFAKGGRQCWLV